MDCLRDDGHFNDAVTARWETFNLANQPTLFDEPKRYHNKDSEDQGQLQ